MSYKLYTDKQEIFECKIYLEGASLEKAKARVLLENNGINLVFNGKIDRNGQCEVPIKKLKGLFEENSEGNMKLEIIADDTYFLPWKSDFVVNTSKKIKVEVKQQANKKIIKPISSKPKVVVSEVKNHVDVVGAMVKTLKENGITLTAMIKNKKTITPILENYSNKIKYKGGTKNFIREIVKKLSKN